MPGEGVLTFVAVLNFAVCVLFLVKVWVLFLFRQLCKNDHARTQHNFTNLSAKKKRLTGNESLQIPQLFPVQPLPTPIYS